MLLLGLGATHMVATRLGDADQAEAQAAFERLAVQVREEVRNRVTVYQYGLRGGRGAFVVRPDLDLAGWRSYCASRDLGGEFHGSLGFGFIWRITPAEQPAHEQRLSAEYGEPVVVHTTGLPDPQPQADRFVISYIEPLAPNRRALGLDIAAEPRRRAAALQAMRSGEGCLTEAIDLVQVGTRKTGFLYLLPVYRPGAPTATEADRLANHRGWVYTPIVMENAMVGLAAFTQGLVDVEVFDSAPMGSTLLYDQDGHLGHRTGPIDASAYDGRHFQESTAVEVAGRLWRLNVSSTPEFEKRFEGHSATTTWLLGSPMTMVAALVLFGLHLSRRRAVALARRMTAELTERNSELEKARLRLDESGRAKERFLANMSHELRTPMNAILGFSQFLADEAVTADERAEYAGAIQRNGDHMLVLINEVLDSAKIEAGMMRVEQIDTSIVEIARDVHTVMRARAEQKGLAFELRWRSSIPDPVRTDPTRVRQVLMNLVGNAIKFTEHGGIRIEVAHEVQTSGPRLLVRVVDTGKGMAPEHLERLFQPFMQAEDSTSREHGGTGLGLSISKQLASLMGGDLYAQCTVGKGCSFVVDLPCVTTASTRWLEPGTERAAPPPRRKRPPKLEGRILLADDGADNRKLISLLLTRAGATVATARNGREAVDMVLAAKADGNPFHLVLMDMQMPVLGGLDATRTLRASQVATPILALTANVLPADRIRAEEAGCVDFLLKPIEHERFFATCARWLGDASVSVPVVN